MTSTTTTTAALAARYTTARAAIATAEAEYLATAVAWIDAIDAGEASARALADAAGMGKADRLAFPWLGRIARLSGDIDALPYRGVVALEADIRTLTNGHTETLRAIVEAAEDAETEPSLETLAGILAGKAATARRKDTTGKAARSGSGPDAPADPATPETPAPGKPETRSLDALLADILADLARVDRVADTLTPEQAATLAVIAAGVESIAEKATVKA